MDKLKFSKFGINNAPIVLYCFYFFRTQNLNLLLMLNLLYKSSIGNLKIYLEIYLNDANFRDCRHKLFSDYFGERAPFCIKKCDICTNKKAVSKMVEDFHVKSIQFSTTASTDYQTNYGDLYSGGKPGKTTSG